MRGREIYNAPTLGDRMIGECLWPARMRSEATWG
jgi:hypothetical protein